MYQLILCFNSKVLQHSYTWFMRLRFKLRLQMTADKCLWKIYVYAPLLGALIFT